MSVKLIINNTEIKLNKGSYKEYPRVIENRNETEAGTTHRNIVRTGIGHLEITMNADESEKAFFDNCVNAATLSVQYWSESAAAMVAKNMFLDPGSYKADLIVEIGEHRYYNVSFTLEEF